MTHYSIGFDFKGDSWVVREEERKLNIGEDPSFKTHSVVCMGNNTDTNALINLLMTSNTCDTFDLMPSKMSIIVKNVFPEFYVFTNTVTEEQSKLFAYPVGFVHCTITSDYAYSLRKAKTYDSQYFKKVDFETLVVELEKAHEYEHRLFMARSPWDHNNTFLLSTNLWECVGWLWSRYDGFGIITLVSPESVCVHV